MSFLRVILLCRFKGFLICFYLCHNIFKIFFNDNSLTILHSDYRIGRAFYRFDIELIEKKFISVKMCKFYHNIPLYLFTGREEIPSPINYSDFNYLLRFTSSSRIESEVVIILELAWKPLCVVIRSENSVARLTFDISSEPETTAPEPSYPGMQY